MNFILNLIHHRLSWLAFLTLMLLTFIKPMTTYVDAQMHHLVGWLSPTANNSQVIHLTYPDELTDIEKKIRLDKALVTMLKSPPSALVLGGDWSHKTPFWVHQENNPLSVDSSIEKHLTQLGKKSLLASPLYTDQMKSTRHIGIVPNQLAIKVIKQKEAFGWAWISKVIKPKQHDKNYSYLVRDLQELVKFSGLTTTDYPPQILWENLHEDNPIPYFSSLALALFQNALAGSKSPKYQLKQSTWNIANPNESIKMSLDGTIWPRIKVSDIRSDALALLNNQTDQLWKNKTVFITPTDDGALKSTAATLASLELQAWDYRPGWDLPTLLFLILILSLYLWLMSSKFSLTTNSLILTLLITLILVSQYVLAITQHWWLSGIWLSQWLVICFFGLSLFEKWQNIFLKHQKTKDEANQMLCVASMEKGELETAFGYLKSCSASTYTKDLLQKLGQQMERKREYQLAIKVYQQLLSFGDRNHEKLHNKISQLQKANTFKSDSNGLNPARTMVLSNTGLQKLQLGRYQTDSIIGQGSMGVVYLGSDPKIGRSVAIKTLELSSEYAGSDLAEAKERFYREAETAGALRHPNIVTIYDVGEEKDLAYIAMDYLKGRPLSDFVKKESLLGVKIVYDLMLQAAQALDYAHSQKIVHRDIKPGNLVYDAEENEVIITDFGIACVTDHSKTRTGTILGSPFYMSPEQIAGAKVDGRADIFSLGVTFYQLLSGDLPFKGESLATLTYSIANQKHIPVRKQRPNLPASATTIINKALQKKKEKRFRTASEMADAIESAMAKIKG